MKFSIVLPIHNEEENLEEVLTELGSVMRPLGHAFEVIAIDDGSTDNSRLVLRDLLRRIEELKIIFLRRNYGEALALDAGFRHASGEFIITMDADGQDDPQEILRLMEKIEEG